MYKKNDIIKLHIDDIGTGGEGIGKVDGYTVFAKDAIIGDEIEALITKPKKQYSYARLHKIIAPSPDRATPPCPVANRCGGCQIQALSYEKQLEFKVAKVRNNLKRIGEISDEILDSTYMEIEGMKEPYRYRNKAQFPIGKDKDGNIIAGFYAGRTHYIIPIDDCIIGDEVNSKILDIILEFIKEKNIEPYDETTHKGIVRHVLIRVGKATDEIMVCLVINGKKLPYSETLVESLAMVKGMTSISISKNTENTNVIMGDNFTVLWGKPYIEDKIGEVRYRISPLSFYQVNPTQTKVLYETALSFASLKGDEEVWDLYCGIGTISLFLAQKAKHVYGVEIVPEAIRDAKENAKINGIENVEFFVGKAEEVFPRFYKEQGSIKAGADVIVIDPPRRGCEESVLETMAKMKPEKIVYVSCDSATFARDIKYLSERGYTLTKWKPVDMFPHSVHIELVGLITRVEK